VVESTVDNPPSDAWVVRIPAGDIFGPATKAQLDEWVAEGRVDGSCLLKREGELEWIAASRVYRQLASASPTSSPDAAAAVVAEATPLAIPFADPASIPEVLPSYPTDDDQARDETLAANRTVQRSAASFVFWMRLGGCCCLVFFGIHIFLAAFRMGEGLDVGGEAGDTRVLAGLVHIVIALCLELAPGFLLLRAAQRWSTFSRAPNPRNLHFAMQAQLAFWRVASIAGALACGVAVAWLVLRLG
jgi:hypothetical protein